MGTYVPGGGTSLYGLLHPCTVSVVCICVVVPIEVDICYGMFAGSIVCIGVAVDTICLGHYVADGVVCVVYRGIGTIAGLGEEAVEFVVGVVVGYIGNYVMYLFYVSRGCIAVAPVL